MLWLQPALVCLHHQVIASAVTNPDQALASTISATPQTLFSWEPVTPPHLFARLPAMLCSHNAILAAHASTTLLATLAGAQVSVPIASSMSSKTSSKSTTLSHLAKKMLNVKTATSGSSSKVTAAIQPPARRANHQARLPRPARKPAKRPAGGAASTSRPQPNRLLRQRP